MHREKHVSNYNKLSALEMNTCWIPCCTSLGWLVRTFVVTLLLTDRGTEGGTLARIHSVWTRMSWAPADRCNPSFTASSETLLTNAIAPGKQIFMLILPTWLALVIEIIAGGKQENQIGVCSVQSIQFLEKRQQIKTEIFVCKTRPPKHNASHTIPLCTPLSNLWSFL